MKDKLEYLEGQCEMLAKVCMELSAGFDGLSDRYKKLVENHNELVRVVNAHTDSWEALDKDMQEAEAMLDSTIVFTPDPETEGDVIELFRDKKKDH